MAFWIEGCDTPEVRLVGCQRERKRERRCLRLDGLGPHERPELGIGRHAEQIIERPGNLVPGEPEGLRGIRDRRVVGRRREGRRDQPLLLKGPRRRPGRKRAIRGDRSHMPPIRPIRDGLVDRRMRVLREEVVEVRAEHGRVEPRVCGDLELVPVGAGDRVPAKRREESDNCPRVRSHRDRRRRRASSRRDGDERDQRRNERRLRQSIPCSPRHFTHAPHPSSGSVSRLNGGACGPHPRAGGIGLA